MTEKIKIQLEYIINCSPKVLFNRLSTASGLTEWFADDVKVKGSVYTFIWGKDEQQAEKKLHRENKLVRFEWLEQSDNDGEKTFFEFNISQDDLTNDVSLHIVDFVEEDEVEEITDLWNTQIAKLKHMLGS